MTPPGVPSQAMPSSPVACGRWAHGLAPLLVALAGCPEDPPALESFACVQPELPCDANGECCGFSEALEPGDAQCVDFGGGPTCTSICTSGGDCPTGCCVALEGSVTYGACGPCSGPPFAEDHCEIGASILCFCSADSEDACLPGDEEALVAECRVSPATSDFFRCLSQLPGETTCAEAGQLCGG